MTLHHGDCLEVMRTMPDASVDAIVTDPPYGLGFMGKHWDHGAPGPDFWREMHRLAKPGAHLLAFGGTRTVHRIAASVEDAGWEIRDMLVWAYASGFPKSLDVSKALDKRAGHWRGRAGAVVVDEQPAKGTEYERTPKGDPVTAAAAAAAGWGTALKPAWEPIVMARKPLIGSVADNWLEHGTGALNIDGTRIPGQWTSWRRGDGSINPDGAGFGSWVESVGGDPGNAARNPESPLGRWPSNVLLSDPELFDEPNPYVVGSGAVMGPSAPASGPTWEGPSGSPSRSPFKGTDRDPQFYGDSGGYSRFFIIPKADRADREPVLGGLALRSEGDGTTVRNARCATCHRVKFAADADRCHCDAPVWEASSLRANVHPTVKPTDLMRHLVRLVTPPGGTVLDPFLGSGTTAIAAEMEGFDWIGIEREAEYVAIAEARLNGTQRGLGLVG